MPHKEFIRLIEENMYILDRLGDRLKIKHGLAFRYSRQQLATIMRLYMGGPAKLKDIARREGITVPNLCATFRKLETGGTVKRKIDENDRRNTWYALTDQGKELADRALEKFREGIEFFFNSLAQEDEKKLICALQAINEILNKMEKDNA
ncbi:MAG: MarR family transcriptional regulator [Rickettsiales bacterium]|jgi:DNA-binding MarR family transcriptional regulator|nr:MarR family transcriptional regulator [Rickettsiales bacterium]